MRNFKNHTMFVFFVSLICLFIIPAPAHPGGIPVFDAANLTQNVQAVIQAIQSVYNQTTQIQNQARQIEYKLRSLKTLGAGSYDQLNGLLNGNIHDLGTLLGTLRSIGYTYGSVRNQYDAIFPQDTAWERIRLSEYGNYFKSWNSEVSNSARTAMEAQSVLDRIQANHQQAIGILSQSRNSDGEVRQLQASNEMLSVLSAQMGDMTQTMSATGRVIATAEAASAAEKRASRRAAELSMQGYTSSSEVAPAYNKLPKIR
jgi:P-type conjugative transfer protein TrbJ